MRLIISFLAFCMNLHGCKHTTNKTSPAELAKSNNENILRGWNTWDNRSILTQVHHPTELALVMQIKDGISGNYLQ